MKQHSRACSSPARALLVAALAILVCMNVFAGQELTLKLANQLMVTDIDWSAEPPRLPDRATVHHAVSFAAAHEKEAIEIRYDALAPCVSTFNRSAFPEKDRQLFVFTAPAKLEQQQDIPETMLSWDRALRKFGGRFVVFANDPLTRQACARHDIPIVCVEHVDEGIPRLDRMYQRMEALQPDGIVAYVNSDISVEDFGPLHDFLLNLNKGPELEVIAPSGGIYSEFKATGKMSRDWFVAVNRYDIRLDGVTEIHPTGGYDFWAWNLRPGGIPLLPFEIPPFRFPLAVYDNWLFDVINQIGQRNIIDATNVAQIYHRQHSLKAQRWHDMFKTGITGVYLNSYLGYNEPRKALLALSPGHEYGQIRYHYQFGTTNEAPYYVSKSSNSTDTEPTLLRRQYWSNLHESQFRNVSGCTLSAAKTCNKTIQMEQMTRQRESWVRGIPRTLKQSKQMSMFESNAATIWRYTLDEQLKEHATSDGYIMLTAVNFVYRAHLMNWICMLERVGMRDNFVIAALDEEIYEWGVLQGLPIFKPSVIGALEKNGDYEFGTEIFKSVTKLKSTVVLEILEAGYSVLFNDVDITWFAHPFEALADHMGNSSDVGILIQSDGPYVENSSTGAEVKPHPSVIPVVTRNATGIRCLNSGFYLAKSTPLVRSAFKEIIYHAKSTTMTEQPSFDVILCARGPSERRGEASCMYRSRIGWETMTAEERKVASKQEGVHVQTLNRFSYPNGAILVGKSNDNVYTLGKQKFEEKTGSPLIAAHNNWIRGVGLKQERQSESGWWFTDEKHSCRFLRDPTQ